MITAVQGKVKSITLPMKHGGVAYVPPSGTSFQFVILLKAEDDLGFALLTKSTGFTVVAQSNLRFELGALDTQRLKPAWTLFYELRATEPSAQPKVVASGSFELTPAPITAVVPSPGYTDLPPDSLIALESRRGDTVNMVVHVTQSGLPFSLASVQVFFTLKTNLSDADGAALIAKDSNAGVTITDADAGEAVVALFPSETVSLPLDVPFFWDIQVKTSAGEIFTVATGTLAFVQHVTQRTT